nr:probable carbohydrate esterase At4g34215 [Ipomoea batatas]
MELPNSTQIHEVKPPKNIFILSGQSNMAGRGGVNKEKKWDGIVPPECSPDSSKIFRLSAQLGWEVACEPLHHDIDTKKTCGVGPGMSFSNAVKDSVGVIGVVPCAVGGTAIKEWARGEHLYENMFAVLREDTNVGESPSTHGKGKSTFVFGESSRAKTTLNKNSPPNRHPPPPAEGVPPLDNVRHVARAQMINRSGAQESPRCRGMSSKRGGRASSRENPNAAKGSGHVGLTSVFQFGESDTSSKHDAESYRANMETLIHNIRSDLDLPTMPIIQVAIASGDKKYIEEVRKAQKEIDLPNVVCIDAWGLELKEDNLHLTTEAQVQLGQMFAEAYLTQFASNVPSTAL